MKASKAAIEKSRMYAGIEDDAIADLIRKAQTVTDPAVRCGRLDVIAEIVLERITSKAEQRPEPERSSEDV